jgi:hypothetical protein
VDCNSSLSTLIVTPHSTGQDAQLQAPHVRVCVCVSLGQMKMHTSAVTRTAWRAVPVVPLTVLKVLEPTLSAN